jgi:hypothetical protein
MNRSAFTLALVCTYLVGCDNGEPLGAAAKDAAVALEAPVATRAETVLTVTSDEAGFYLVSFEIGEGTTSMMVDIANITNGTPVSVVELYDPRGDVVVTDRDLDVTRLSSLALYPTGHTAQLPYPVAADAPAQLLAGEWTVLFGLYTLEGARVRQSHIDAVVRIVTKADPDPAQGRLDVHVVYVDGIEEDEALIEGVSDAIAQWQRFAAKTHGLRVGVRTSVADATLKSPFIGAPAYAELSAHAQPYELTILVGDVFDNALLLGQAGGIPGSLAPSTRTGMGIAVRSIAGVDGELNADEVRTLSQVFAHEVGHYLGLKHVVEGNYESYDDLDDTAECIDQAQCEALLASNLMYPYSLGAIQRALTDNQLVVAHRALAVD